MTAGSRYRHPGPDHGVVAPLPTDLMTRYRAVDREVIPAPSAVDTPAHLDRLSESIAANGIRVPLRMGFNSSCGYLDGNHRIAVALRLGQPDVPDELVPEDEHTPRGAWPAHAPRRPRHDPDRPQAGGPAVVEVVGEVPEGFREEIPLAARKRRFRLRAPKAPVRRRAFHSAGAD